MGDQQAGHSSPFQSYTCCYGKIRGSSSGGGQGLGDLKIAGMGGTGLRNQYCHTQFYMWNSSGFGQGAQRNEDLCSCWYQEGRYVHCTSGDPYTGNKFPGGPGTSAISCAGVHYPGQPGAGGQVIVKYV